MSSDADSGTDERRGEQPAQHGLGTGRPVAAADSPQRGDAADARGATPSDALVAEFAQSFRASYRTLWTIAAGIVNDPGVAEDIVQEAALTALGKLNEFEPHSNFTAWMAKIVRFLSLNQSRRQRRQPMSVDPVAMDDSLPARHDASSGAARSAVDSAGRLDPDRSSFGPFDDHVLHALNSVSDIARACLLLRTVQGLNYDEIAKALEIPAGTAMSHVHRTRMLLRERLADRDPANRGTGKSDATVGDDPPPSNTGGHASR